MSVTVELCQHLVKDLKKLKFRKWKSDNSSLQVEAYLKLASDTSHVLAAAEEGTALRDGEVYKVRVVDGIPCVHGLIILLLTLFSPSLHLDNDNVLLKLLPNAVIEAHLSGGKWVKDEHLLSGRDLQVHVSQTRRRTKDVRILWREYSTAPERDLQIQEKYLKLLRPEEDEQKVQGRGKVAMSQ